MHQSTQFNCPVLAADALVIRKEDDKLLLLMITRLHPPYGLAFPGGHIDYGESCETAVLRELSEETNLQGKNVKLFGVYSEPNRDPRKHVCSIVYEVEVEDTSSLKAGDDAKQADWYDIKDLEGMKEKIAFDHHQIICDYIKSKGL
jgi:8-oxo-dGTP diphosphatase